MADYEDQIAAFRTQSAAPEGDTYEDQIGSFRRQQSEEMGRLRASASLAAETTPERVAQQRRLSLSTGLPMEVVKTAEGEAKAIAKYNELAKLSQTSPVLRAKLQNPEFTALAQNDGEALSGIEKTMKVIGGTAGRVLAGGTVEVGATLMDFSGFVNDMISQAAKAGAPVVEGILPINPLGQIAEAAAGGAAKNRQQAKDARASIDYFLPEATNSTEAGLYSGAQSAGFNLATLPAAIEAAIVKGPQAAGQVMGAIAALATGSRSYNEARDKGLDPMGSITYAAPAAAAEYLFEKWAGGKFFDDVAARSPVMKMLLNNATREVFGEWGTTLTQNFNEWVRLNPEKTVREFISEQPEALYQTMIAALVGSGIQTGAMKGIQKLADRQNQSLVNIDEITKLQDMMRIAAGSDLLAKDPQTFKDYVQAVADGTEGAPKSVWVDGRVLQESLAQSGVTPEQLATILPSVQSQLAEGVSMNTPVEIPVGELATAAGTEIEKALMPHLRTSADGLSLTEAQQEQEQAQQYLQQEAQRIIGQAADQVQANAQAENVRQIIAEQLFATGRYSKDVADKGAKLVGDFYTVMAQRTGMTPDALYREVIDYKVRAQGQGALTQITPEQAMATNVKMEMPTDPTFAEAVGNTPGAQITERGLLIDLVRYQKPEQEGAQAIRTGVFYLPNGAATAKHYKGGKGGYGGAQAFTGETLIRRPLFVKGATGGKAPEVAYDQLKGKKAYNNMREDVLKVAVGWGKTEQQKVDGVREVLTKYNADPSLAAEIVRNSREGNQLPYAVQENIVAHAVREAGYDAVVGYSKGKSGANISEVFDVREQSFPARGMESEVHSVFDQAANGTTAYAADTITIDGKERPALNSNGQRIAATEEGLRNFWAWFGDSKVVDADGKPLVVYHGTDTGGFTSFYETGGEVRGDLGIFATSNREMAKTYVKRGRAQDLTAEQLGEDMPQVSGLYPVYMKIENPHEAFFEGAHWQGERPGKYQVENADGEVIYTEEGKAYFDSLVEAADFALENGGKIEPAADHFETTDGVVREARRYGNDGAIIHDVVDDGGGASAYIAEPSMVYVTFDPTHVKSATGNNGQFNPRDANVLHQTPASIPAWAREKSGTRITDKVKGMSIALAPKAALAERNYAKLDEIFKAVPDPLASEKDWRKFMSLLTGDSSVVGVPYRAFEYARNPQVLADYLKRMRPDQLESRRRGFALGAAIREQYTNGTATPQTTGRLLLWAMLSRKAGAYPHESAYMDLVNGGVDQWIDKAVRGDWTEQDGEAYARWSADYMATKKGGVSPGAGVTSNANDFGRILLAKMSAKGEDGRTLLTQLHDMMADPNVSTDQIRRAFFGLGDGLGIQNKVLSFAMLVTGRWDTLVLDRVQFTHLWGDEYKKRAGQNNIYDGNGGGLQPIGDGHFGIAVYEALDRGLRESVAQAYKLAGLEGQGDGTLGAFHWDSWLVESSQAIAHPTVEAIPEGGTPRPDLAVKQGKFDTYSHGFEYRADGQYQIPLLSGAGYRILSPAEAAEFANRLKEPKEGVVPNGFKVSEHKEHPWTEADGVDRERYDAVLAEYGRPADAADVAAAGLADASGSVQGSTASGLNRDRAGRYARGGLAPLAGAPSVAGAAGPDPRLVAVAERYARENGIDLKRQAEYVQVDPARAERIAAAYAAMEHAPQNPQVRAAYQNLIEQTLAQYRALEAAGYRFYLVDETNDPYGGNPWNAMRDLRANQVMGVFATEAGFGSGATDLNVEDNPLLADTGLRWPYGSLDGQPKRVLANDLFRAVHDAFGHGLEGAGFRAEGEENAWQAHVRLFTGSAVAAITSETRGQNSWLNYGPYGESNRAAKVEDTVFADQKTGLMPEWTWTEGRVADMPEQPVQQPDTLAQSEVPNKYQTAYLAGRDISQLTDEELGQYQALSDNAQPLEQPAGKGPRGTYDIASMTTVLNGTADLSTFLHETGHFFLDAIRRMVLSGNATPEVQAMYEQALKGLNVTPQQWEQWHEEYATTGKISDGMRAAHERWAESFELYLFSGQSPNPGTQSLFRTFAEWLKRVYTSMQQFATSKGLTMDADLKAVMDKMLATDEQIAEAEAIAGLLPDLDATGEAREKLNARSMRDLQWARNAVNKYIAKLQKEARGLRAEIEEEVRAELAKQPVFAALRFIKKGEATVDGEEIKATTGHKINTDALKEMYPETMLARPDLTKLKGLTNKEGLHPDVLADSFGFPSGDALIRALIEANLEAEVEGMTDQRMLERHGDLATPEAIAAAAVEAVHNEARAKSLATELAAQREMLGTRRDTGEQTANGAKRTVNVLVEAAKAFAQNVIGRRAVKGLKKAAWAHLQAERRAGKAWEAATAAGDTQAAVQAKQDQMLNNAAVRAAQEAQADVRAALDLFKKITKGNNEALVKRGFDPDVVNAARAILAAYGVTGPQSKSALEYLELVQKNDPAMYAAIQPSVVAALTNAKPFDELTVAEVGALKDEIESLWHLAKRSRQMEVDGNLLDREEVQDDLRADLEARGIPDAMPGDTSAITPQEQALRKLMVFRAAATRVENWAQNMGANFTKFVFQPIKEAADHCRAAKAEKVKALHALLKPIEGSLKKGEIKADELNGYVFGKDTSGVGMAEVLHALIHTGNDSNKRKLLLGRGWASENEDGTLNTSKWDAFIERMVQEGKLTQAHYDFAQGVWDLFESTKPLAQKTHRDVFGRYFAEVTANSFVDPFGITRRGGYAPAITDTRIVSDAATRSLMETENQSMAYAFPSTSKGFTVGRVEYNKPLLLDLRVLAQHLDKVLLFSYMESPVRDVRRVLSAKNVSYGLNRIDPVAFDNVITPWLNRAARQQVEAPIAGDAGLMRIFSAARNRAGMAAMFANVANAAQQLTGFAIAAVKVKPTYLMSAAAQMIAAPKQMIADVSAASVYMRERMENDVANAESAIRDILLDASVYEKAQQWSAKHAYFLQSAVDNAMGPVIWTGAFNQATEQGLSQKDAVRFADSVIRTTQGSTLPEDVSRIETGNAFVRMFTQFGGYFNMQANLLGTEFAKVARELGVKQGAGKMLYITLLGFLAPAWVGEAIMQVFRGGPDDEDKDGEYLDDWLAAIFGWSTLRGVTAMIPGVGQTINAGVNAWNSKPYDDRMGSAPAISTVEAAVRSPASVYKAVVEDGSRQKAVRDVASLISVSTGLPATAVARPLGYLAGMSDSSINPTSGGDMARGLATGYASPESK